MKKIIPKNKKITTLLHNEIFVFGSNLAGIHGAGAAKDALQWGAKLGIGFGLQGFTFAIPTKDHNIKTLPIKIIKSYVDLFIMFIQTEESLKDYTFLITEIGCGYAGYKPFDIAPLFKEAVKLDNVYLPERFIKELEKQNLV